MHRHGNGIVRVKVCAASVISRPTEADEATAVKIFRNTRALMNGWLAMKITPTETIQNAYIAH